MRHAGRIALQARMFACDLLWRGLSKRARRCRQRACPRVAHRSCRACDSRPHGRASTAMYRARLARGRDRMDQRLVGRIRPSWLCAGSLVLGLGHAVFLALEFMASYRVSGRDPLPAPAPAMRAGMARRKLDGAAASSAGSQPFRSRAVPDHLPEGSRQRGVVLIHGFVCNRGFWNPWLRAAARRGPCLRRGQPGAGLRLDRALRADHRRRHRARDRSHGAAARADLPQHGRPGALAPGCAMPMRRACTASSPSARRTAAPGSRASAAPPTGARCASAANGCSRSKANAASTRQVPFTCWYSNCDNIVFPTSTATLPGADNRLAPGRGHVEMAFVPGMRRETLALLED